MAISKSIKASGASGSAHAEAVAAALKGERERIAQKLHDTLCQEVTGIRLMTNVMGRQLRKSSPEAEKKLEEIGDMIQRAGAGLHILIRDLRGG